MFYGYTFTFSLKSSLNIQKILHVLIQNKNHYWSVSKEQITHNEF